MDDELEGYFYSFNDKKKKKKYGQWKDIWFFI